MSEKRILVLSGLDVQKVTLRLPVPQLLQAVLRSLSESPGTNNSNPPRSAIQSPRHNTLFMPSRVESLATTSIKVVAVPKDGVDGGLPATTLVMDELTGGLDAVVNARALTALRTAAASTLATELCLGASNARPTHLVLFGAGAQSHAHASLLISTFPTIKRCTIINRTKNARLGGLLDRLRMQLPPGAVEVVGLAGDAHVDIERAVRSASIICTATSAAEPLFPAEWVSSGAHVNLVGSYTPRMCEVSPDLLRRAKIVVVDSREACAREAGELIGAGIGPDEVVELGELDGVDNVMGVAGEGDVSIYKSVGVGVMDVAVARLVVDKARELGVGVSVPYD